MSFAIEFQGKWKNKKGIVHQLDIERDGYGGGINTIITLNPVPVTINKRATKTDGDIIISGSELEFRFISNETDISSYDVLFESTYKIYRVSFYVDSNLRWRGWVKPENYNKDFVSNGAHYHLSLSATDAIADLKNIPYGDYSDRANLITQLDRCLLETDVSLGYRIQLNTYESSIMSSTDSVFDNVTANSRRFEENKDGRIVQTNCNQVLTEIIKPFNAHLLQSNGKYWVVNPHELNSFYFPVDFSTGIIGARVSNDLRIDISNWDYTDRGSVERLVPFENVGTTFQNRDLGETLISNGDFSAGSTGWIDSGFVSVTYTNGYAAMSSVLTPLLDTPPDVLYQDIGSIDTSTGDTFTVKFKHRLHSLSPDDSAHAPILEVRLKIGATYGAAVQVGVVKQIIYQGSGDWTEFNEDMISGGPGNYWIEFLSNPDDFTPHDTCDFWVDDVEMTQNFAEGSTDITFDQYFNANNLDDDWIDTAERKIFFGDSIQTNDIGAFKIGIENTDEWNRYNKTDGRSIQQLYGQNILENYAQYKDYVRLNIIDDDDEIHPHNLITLNSKNYRIIGFSESYKSNSWKNVSCELEEMLTTDISVGFSITSLTTIDGKSTTTTTGTTGTGVVIDDSGTSSLSVWSSFKTDQEIDSAALTSTWGNIGGSLSNQTDVSTAIDTKSSIAFNLIQDASISLLDISIGNKLTKNNFVNSKIMTSGATGELFEATATAANTNALVGISAAATIQNQLDNKQAYDIIQDVSILAGSSGYTINRALISNGSGQIAVSPSTTSTEIGYVAGLTSAVQTQLNSKSSIAFNLIQDASISLLDISIGNKLTKNNFVNSKIMVSGATGELFEATATAANTNALVGISAAATIQNQLDNKQAYDIIQDVSILAGSSGYTASRALISNSGGEIAVSPSTTSTQIGYLGNTTSNIQTQLDNRQPYDVIQDASILSGFTPWITAGSDIYYNAGDVGIGTASPSDRLDVRMPSDVNQVGLTISSPNTGGVGSQPAVQFKRYSSGILTTVARVYGEADGGGSSIRFATSPTSAKTTPTDRLTIDSEGNVGIGTTSPDGTLHVHTATAGSVTPAAGADDLIVENSAAGGISILTPDSQSSTINFGSPGDVNHGVITSNWNNKLMQIGTAGTSMELALVSGVAAEAIRIDSAGNVGIGTDIPEVGLHVKGAFPTGFAIIERTGVNGGGSAGVVQYKTDGKTIGDGVVFDLAMRNSADEVVSYAQLRTSIISPTDGAESSNLKFFTYNAGVNTEHIRILNNGNVGIGTTDPSVKLHVIGDVIITGDASVAGDVLADGEIEGFASSDIRFKEDIKPLDRICSTNDILSLKPKRFFHKKHGKNELGLIAQDVEKIYPEMVKEDRKGYKYLDYAKLSAPIISMLQRQENRIRKLEKIIEELL